MLRAAMLLFALLTAATAAPADELPPEVTCARVVDGDTIVCEGADGKRFVVRLVGVDAPETVHPRKEVQPFGPEASAHLKGILVGRDGRLVPDPAAGDVDRYGRRLAWVFLGASCVNEDLVRDGYGRAYLQYKFAPVMRVVDRHADEADQDGVALRAHLPDDGGDHGGGLRGHVLVRPDVAAHPVLRRVRDRPGVAVGGADEDRLRRLGSLGDEVVVFAAFRIEELDERTDRPQSQVQLDLVLAGPVAEQERRLGRYLDVAAVAVV
ncbi:hypothetical protein HK102_008292 [Quaeritorhiza haematococci]|nr:hypothetical protein HK102_008292 [Quaeritorhiza haematococci]